MPHHLQGNPVGPALINTEMPSSVFNQALSSKQPQGKIKGHYFNYQPLLINGEPSELSLLLITDDMAFQQLQKTNIYHLLLALVLVLLALLVLLLYRMKISVGN